MLGIEVVLDESIHPYFACVENSMALTNIQKVVATVLRRYHIEPVDEKEELRTHSVGIAEKAGPLHCRIRFRKNISV